MQLLIRIKFLLLALLFLCFKVNAQECTTPNIEPQEAMNLPWFGNPNYLPSFMDSVRSVDGIPSASSRIVSSIRCRIPIHF